MNVVVQNGHSRIDLGMGRVEVSSEVWLVGHSRSAGSDDESWAGPAAHFRADAACKSFTIELDYTGIVL